MCRGSLLQDSYHTPWILIHTPHSTYGSLLQDEGNDKFSEGKYQDALDEYQYALDLFKYADEL